MKQSKKMSVENVDTDKKKAIFVVPSVVQKPLKNFYAIY